MAWILLLGLCFGPERARAQDTDTPPSSEARPAQDLATEPAESASAAEAPQAPQQPAATDAAKSVLPAAPSPAATARAGLDALGAREDVAQKKLASLSMTWPGLALGLGIPIVVTTIPIGALLLANAGNDTDAGAAHERRVGAGLLSAGAVGLAGLIYGAIQVHRTRMEKRLLQYELQAISVQRTVLDASLSPGAEASTAATAARLQTRVRAAEARRLTSRGRIALTGGIDVGYVGSQSDWTLRVAPGFAFFVRDRLAVGAFMDAGRGRTAFSYGQSRIDRALGGGFRMIYEVPVGSRGGLWLWPYLAYAWQSSEYHYPAPPAGLRLTGTETTTHVIRLGLLLPLMFHLSDSWAVGAGPRAEYNFATGAGLDGFNVGLASQLIGSF